MEAYTLVLWDITKGIVNLEQAIVENQVQNWRNVKTLYEKVILAVDCAEMKTDNVQSTKLQEILGKQTELNMQYFMLNKICMEFIDNAFTLMTEGIQPVRQASLDFICKMTVSIGSTSMRL